MNNELSKKSVAADKIYVETLAKLNDLKARKKKIIDEFSKKVDSKKISKIKAEIEKLK